MSTLRCEREILDRRAHPSYSAPVEFKTIIRPTATVIELTGRFDIVRSRSFEAHLATVTEKAPASVALDMTGLHYIDSSGINVLTRARKVIKDYGGALILVGLSPGVVNVLKFGAIDGFFRIVTVDDFEREHPSA